MHLPDGFLSAPVAAAAAAATAAGAATAARGALRFVSGRLAAASCGAAAVFAAQAGNFPVAAGVSAHVLGGALLGATLGFAPAFALVAPVVVVQALLGDGGLLALGANLLNMAVVAPLVAAALAREGGPARRGVAAFVGTLAAVGACALELVLSGRGPAGALAGDLLLYHVPVAALEGFLAFAWVAYAAESPALRRAPARAAALCAGGLACAALFAVSSPDGLEHVAEVLGFAGLAR